jgi:hypothetical protein
MIPDRVPWWATPAAKLALACLSVPYRTWRRSGGFVHGAMLDAAFARRIVGGHERCTAYGCRIVDELGCTVRRCLRFPGTGTFVQTILGLDHRLPRAFHGLHVAEFDRESDRDVTQGSLAGRPIDGRWDWAVWDAPEIAVTR